VKINHSSNIRTLKRADLFKHTFSNLNNDDIRTLMRRTAFNEDGNPNPYAALRYVIDPAGNVHWSEGWSTQHSKQADELGYHTYEEKKQLKGGVLENKTLQTLSGDVDLNAWAKANSLPGEIDTPEKIKANIAARGPEFQKENDRLDALLGLPPKLSTKDRAYLRGL